jgi:hypothetical protein
VDGGAEPVPYTFGLMREHCQADETGPYCKEGSGAMRNQESCWWPRPAFHR